MKDVVTNLLGEMVEVRRYGGQSYLEGRGKIRALWQNDHGVFVLLEDELNDATEPTLHSFDLLIGSVKVVRRCARCYRYDHPNRLVGAGMADDGGIAHEHAKGFGCNR